MLFRSSALKLKKPDVCFADGSYLATWRAAWCVLVRRCRSQGSIVASIMEDVFSLLTMKT